MSRPPLCFVLMPFGRKPDAAGVMIDFDAVYREIIAPPSRTRAWSPSERGAHAAPRVLAPDIGGGQEGRVLGQEIVRALLPIIAWSWR